MKDSRSFFRFLSRFCLNIRGGGGIHFREARESNKFNLGDIRVVPSIGHGIGDKPHSIGNMGLES